MRKLTSTQKHSQDEQLDGTPWRRGGRTDGKRLWRRLEVGRLASTAGCVNVVASWEIGSVAGAGLAAVSALWRSAASVTPGRNGVVRVCALRSILRSIQDEDEDGCRSQGECRLHRCRRHTPTPPDATVGIADVGVGKHGLCVAQPKRTAQATWPRRQAKLGSQRPHLEAHLSYPTCPMATCFCTHHHRLNTAAASGDQYHRPHRSLSFHPVAAAPAMKRCSSRPARLQ